MKRFMPLAVGTVALCWAMGTGAWAEELLPGQVDFGTFSPPGAGGEFVEVNVPAGLISLGAHLVKQAEPDVAKLLEGLKLVRVNVIGLSEDNRADLQQRAEKVRKDLAGNGWERIVTAQQNKQDVSVYLKMNKKGAVQGLVAVVLDGKEHAVFANVVGEIRPDQLAMLGEKLNLDPLKDIGHATKKSPEAPKPAEKAEQ